MAPFPLYLAAPAGRSETRSALAGSRAAHTKSYLIRGLDQKEQENDQSGVTSRDLVA